MIQHLNTEQTLCPKIRTDTYFVSASFTKDGRKVRLPEILPILLLVRIRHHV